MAKNKTINVVKEESGVELDGYIIQNKDKYNRAIFGTIGRSGALEGGVGEKADKNAILAEYDKLGGLVLKDGRKIKTGSFYDFEKKEPRVKPVIVFELKDLEGNVVEIPEGDEIPLEVKAVEIKNKKKQEKVQEEDKIDA